MNGRVKAIYTLYLHNKITLERLQKAVPKIISAEEFKEITKQTYSE